MIDSLPCFKQVASICHWVSVGSFRAYHCNMTMLLLLLHCPQEAHLTQHSEVLPHMLVCAVCERFSIQLGTAWSAGGSFNPCQWV